MTVERSTIMMAIFMVCIMALLAVVIHNDIEKYPNQGPENLTQIKEDAYARGLIDGRKSCPGSQEDTVILTGVTMSCNATDSDGNSVKVNCVV